MKINSLFPTARLGMALVLTALPCHLLYATPYATCLTNNVDGTVSFRLNQTTGTNDLVAVIVCTTTNLLQIPSGGPTNKITRALTTTNISISTRANLIDRIKHNGS